jgi:hypothetical protein
MSRNKVVEASVVGYKFHSLKVLKMSVQMIVRQVGTCVKRRYPTTTPIPYYICATQHK